MKRIRLKHVVKIIMGQSPPSDEVNEIGLGRPFLQGNSDFGTSHPIARTYCDSSPKKATAGDLLLSVRAPVGAMNSADHEYGIGRGLCAVRAIASRMNQRFANYSIIANLDSLKSVAVGSTYDAVTTSDVGMLTIHIGDLDFQSSVSDFLDRKTAEADALVAKYERLIELLEEKRVALITQAVTKGLDPNSVITDSDSDSDIEWIGHVPEHWKATRIKFCASKIGSGVTPRGGSESYVSDGVTFLRSQNVYDDGLRLDDVAHISHDIDNEMSRTRIHADDVLLNITGASIGRTCIAPASVLPANVNQHVCIIRPAKNVLPEYLAYTLKSRLVREQITAGENGSSREGLNYDQVGNLCIAIPNSLDEQRRIITHINSQMNSISKIRAKVKKAMHLIAEHRSALITATVTGQIDVSTYRSENQPIEVSA